MINGKTIWLAVNAASGSNSDAALAELEAAFAAASCTIARRIGFHDEGAPSLAELRRETVDILAIYTGDGTVNALVTGLYGWEGAVLVLPGGTKNILARRLHGEAAPDAIIAAVAAGKARRTRPTMVRTRWGDGLSGIVAGPGTAWNDVREAIRETDVIAAISTAAGAIGESTGGSKVVCREPGCGRDDGYTAIQLTPTDAGMAIEGYYVETIADYAKQGLALLRRDFRDGPHESLGLHQTVHLACPQGDAMGLLIDGEPAEGTSEERFALAHCEVDLLATADGE